MGQVTLSRTQNLQLKNRNVKFQAAGITDAGCPGEEQLEKLGERRSRTSNRAKDRMI